MKSSSTAALSNLSSLSSITSTLLLLLLQAYGVKVVPNMDRDFPDIHEIPLPASLLMDFHHTRSHTGTSTGAHAAGIASSSNHMGKLIGAFEIPLLPGVVVDDWRETQAPHR